MLKTFIFFFLNYFVQTFSLHDKKPLKKYLPYCQAFHNHIPQKNGMQFLKLIVIHRHGDRTPMKTLTKINDNCINCNIKRKLKDLYKIEGCFLEKCIDGALTKKGYKQMINLGKFIKENYFKNEKISMNDLTLRATLVPRTHSSLNGLVTGLFLNSSTSEIIPD
ncbi:Lysosomal & prostatic acid phosphatase, partial [Pseudoloma neurophilia]